LIRVLHLSTGTLFGGVETYLLALVRHGQASGLLESSFALAGEGRLGEELRVLGAPVHPLGNVRVRRPSSVREARFRLSRLLERERFDAVVCHSPWAQALFAPVARDAGVPVTFQLHGHVTGRHWLELWARQTPPDLVIANSEFTAGTLPNLYPRARVELIRYPVEARSEGVNCATRRELRDELCTPEDDVVIVQSCRMEPWKGHRLHLEALSRLRDLHGWTSWVVGGAQRGSEIAYRADLERMAARIGIQDRVRFVGQRRDVPRILRAADIHCQPNIGPEPFGIAFVEALYAGIPVVTTAMGGAKEIIDTSCGVLTEPGDADALAMALRELVVDPVLRRRLGAAGPARAARLCDPDTQVRRLSAAIASLGASGEATPRDESDRAVARSIR
jgi:glycosyltransferase involved in cell wall biosynthesis